MKLAVVLVVLVVGSLIFHFISPWWFTPIASNWQSVDDTINITFWVTGFVFVAVNLFLAYTIYRYRFNQERKASYNPENKKLELGLTAFTAVGVIAMLAPGLVVWGKFVEVPEGSDVVEVVGQQWQWSYRFPGNDGVLGRSDARYFGEDNPLGIDPTDEKGRDDIVVLTNDLHLPVDRPVKILLRSKDVLHNFAVPQFRVKMDLVPGIVSYFWFTPTRVGTFDILCMELCGIAHHAMRGKVHVRSEVEFNTWLGEQISFAEMREGEKGDPQQGQAFYTVCAGCHGQQGEGNIAFNAPSLSSQPAWYLKRQLQYYKQGIRGAHEEDTYGQQMSAMTATLPDEMAIKHVSAYIESLNPVESEATLDGNSKRGKSLYLTCGACHGKKGEGNYALSAPSLAGVQDWYLKRQIMNFKQGIRGTHKQDNYGEQMILMAKMLSDEEAIDDLVSYINTLKP